jgi:ABC-type uncharacterized transport system substrate-binding protein
MVGSAIIRGVRGPGLLGDRMQFDQLTRRESIALLVVSPDPYLTTRRDQVVAQSARHGIAVISDRREFVAAGGLMSYGTDFGDAYHEMAVYVGRILKGAKPAELPVQQAVKIQFAINLKTAKSLGLTTRSPFCSTPTR